MIDPVSISNTNNNNSISNSINNISNVAKNKMSSSIIFSNRNRDPSESSSLSGEIDISKMNENTRKKYTTPNHVFLEKQDSLSGTKTKSFNDDEGLKKSPLCEFDSSTKEFSCSFPDFSDIDMMHFLYAKSNQIEQEIIIQSDKYVDTEILMKLFEENHVTGIVSNYEFEVGHLLYRQKNEVYVGRFHPNNDDEKKFFIKKFWLRNKPELQAIFKELSIFFKLYRDSTTFNDQFMCRMMYFYYDSNDKALYTFYEYYEKNLFEFVTENDDINIKLNILNKLLNFGLLLHSNGVLHRDLRLDLFFFNDGVPKTFDLANALQINLNGSGSKRASVKVAECDFVAMVPIIQKQLESGGLFFTPKFVAPELTSLEPSFGYAEDIWSFACICIEMFIKYSDYQKEMISRLLNRVFRGDDYLRESVFGGKDDKLEPHESSKSLVSHDAEQKDKIELKYAIPKIPKSIPKEIAQVIATCFYIQPINRPNILTLVEKFNIVFKKYSMRPLEVGKQDRGIIDNFCMICELIYKNYYNERTSKIENKWKECPYHVGSFKNYYCETCNDFFCDNSIIMAHKDHMYEVLSGNYTNVYTVDGEKKVENLEIEELLSEKTMLKAYQIDLEKMEMEKNFKIIEEFSQSFEDDYKDEKERINSQYEIIKKKIDELEKSELFALDQAKEKFETTFKKLFNDPDSFRVPIKYIFRHELYTDEVYKYLKSLEMKINTEKKKIFDYSDSDSLFLTKELIMIIPLTSCVFSYSKNSYKKFKVDFEKNKVKLNSFLPGCATLHQGPFFYVTGGEIKDEATSNFIFMNIDEKIIDERIEMNYPRRFHTMLGIETKNKKFILVIGGWDCNEVEYINSNECAKWCTLPSMKYKRSDTTAYLFDNKFIYVFGGWDYSQKKCVGDVERYQIISDNDDDDLNTNGHWEIIKIKGETISLQKYNMGLIKLMDEKTENSEKIILVGGFDESYDYSQSVVKIEIMDKDSYIFVNKDIKGLPTGGESSFWYEKEFHVMSNDLDGEKIAVNFNCFNNIYVYTYRTNEFKQYANSTSKI